MLNSQNSDYYSAYDRFGNKYSLNDLAISNNRISSSGSVTSAGTTSLYCTAGYFNLYYEAGSFFDPSANPGRIDVLCEMFSNLSGFILSPLTTSSTTPKVNIYCGTSTNTTGLLAQAGAFYVMPSASSFYAQSGFIESQVFKTIVSGQDAYQNLPSQYFTNSAPTNFFHGEILASPSGTINWNFGLTAPTASTDIDAYSVFFHEAIHLLGFASLINSNTNSVFGAGLNYYSTYDRHLYDNAGNRLIVPTGTSCPSSAATFTAAASSIGTATSGCSVGNTPCGSAAIYSSSAVTATVYTPSCFELGSSLSHFEDACFVPSTFTATAACYTLAGNSNNNLYYAMSDRSGPGTCYIKRYLKEEEKKVMCDLGYSVSATFTSNAAAANHTYTSGSCAGKDVWGINDGFNGTAFTLTTTANTFTTLISALTANDATTTTQASCIDVIYGLANATSAAGVLTVTPIANYYGLIILRYFPTNASQVQGNETYVFVYFVPDNCGPIGTCNLVQNGGFENVNLGEPCGNNVASYPTYTIGTTQIGCWDRYENVGQLFTRNCTSTLNTSYNLAVNTISTIPVFDSYNGTPNDRVLGLPTASNSATSGASVLKNHLASTLTGTQVYQVSMLLANYVGTQGTSTINAGGQPIVVTVASGTYQTPFGSNYPNTLNQLADFTVPAMTNTNAPWIAYTQTFVSSAANGHNAIMLGPNTAATFSNAPSGERYVFVDEVQIVPMPTATFVIPTATACGYYTYTNLAQYASAVNGVFEGKGVSISGANQYNFNVTGTLSPGFYPVSFTYTSSTGCSIKLWQNILVTPPLVLSPAGTSSFCINTTQTLATTIYYPAQVPSNAYTLQPGAYSGPNAIITPTANTTYTYFVTDPITSCISTNTLAVQIQTNCCTAAGVVRTATSIATSTTIGGTNTFLNSFTVQPGQSLNLYNGEYIFAPDVKITISPSAQINLSNAHLYSCGSNMWTGIDVLDGGGFLADPGNLIEDAKTAVRAANQYTTTGSVIVANNTVFNKNYIDIAVSKHSGSPINITECVFTCRTLTFTSSSWPLSGTSTGDLRNAVTATTGIGAPYLSNSLFPLTTLKKPYLNQYSNQAISFADVGVTTGTTFISATVGSSAASSLYAYSFNLFDAHGNFITAINSNVTLSNNVFQNTKRYVGLSGIITTTIGGTAISSENYYKNSKLDLTSSTFDVGNRFWDCHTSIKAIDLLRLNMEKALIRSTQTNTLSGLQPGTNGLQLGTCRFQYYIKDNEFTNIAYPINIPIAAGVYTSISTGTQTGIYADRIIILDNIFASGSTAGQNISTAVNISCPNQVPFTIANDYNIVPYTKAIVVEQNTITAVERGVAVNGITGFQTTIESNSITLRGAGSFQHGIDLSSCMSASNAVGQYMIITNTLTGAAPSASLESLVFCSDNIGIYSPSVTCNALSNSHQGFVFNMTNTLAVWAGNIMQPLNRGLVLTGYGKIGAQGTFSISSNNEWRGTWSNYHTHVDAISNSTDAVLYVKAGGVTEPTLNGGPQSSQNFDPVNNSIFYTTGGDYECGGVPNSKIINPPNAEGFDDPISYSNIRHAFYRFLEFNDSIRNPGNSCDDYYQSLNTSNTDKFLDVELKLYQGDVADALSIIDDITIDGTDILEENCKAYYQLYANYLQLAADSIYTAADSAALYYLANLCPASNGPCVYQARALVNTIYQVTAIYPDCDEETGARGSASDAKNFIAGPLTIEDMYKVYPNPAGNEVKILCENPNLELQIEIKDLVGRVVLLTKLKEVGNVVTLNFDLPNGAYFLKISNTHNEQTTKKLLISK
jgi:hypothetical protein